MLNAQEKSRLNLLRAKIDAATTGGASIELTPDDERFLDLVALKSEKQNIRKKALAGGTLTGAQRARLSSLPQEEGVAVAVAFVQNWDELADAIPLNRRTLQNFREDHADLIKANEKRLIKSDGRKCVVEWRSLIAECGVKGRGANNTDPDSLDARQLELQERRYKLERAKFELDKAKEAMLPCAQFELALAKTIAAFLAALNAFAPRVNEMLEGLEYDDRAAVIETEVDLIRKTLAGCDYLNADDDDGE